MKSPYIQIPFWFTVVIGAFLAADMIGPLLTARDPNYSARQFQKVGQPIPNPLPASQLPAPADWVLVAASDLPVGTVIERSFFARQYRWELKPTGEIPTDVVRDPEKLIGKRLVRTLRHGEAFSTRDLSSSSVMVIPAGKKVVSHKLLAPDRQDGASFEPGSHLDVVIAIREMTGGKPRYQYALTNILVVAIDYQANVVRGHECGPPLYVMSLVVSEREASILRSLLELGLGYNLIVQKEPSEPAADYDEGQVIELLQKLREERNSK